MPFQVEAVKLFVLKTINLATLVYQLFLIQTNANTTQKYLQLDNYADFLTVCLLSFASAVRQSQWLCMRLMLMCISTHIVY